MTRTLVLAFPDGLASSLAITLDALETANHISRQGGRRPPFQVQTVPLRRAGPVKFTHGDLLIVPGLGGTSEQEVIARLATLPARRAIDLVGRASKAGASIAASCAGTFVLAEAGLLSARRATTTWWLAALFRRRYPDVRLEPDAIVMPDWPLATAGAAMAQMDLMLSIIAKFASPALSAACARYLVLDRRRSQAPYMALAFLAGQDETVAQAEAWVRQNIRKDFSVDAVADAVGLSPRTFARRLAAVCGLSPIRFVQRIRIEAAEVLLETTRLPVDAVARQVGYAEPSTLRRLIRREARRSPAEWRRGRVMPSVRQPPA
ncbi:GlxA family transcriptional regulator [Reyranella sp. CPCC 100927]|uniref:GlxA family transcriptional regulator n=1 Tax=Reyranella sp. CPCC 100927 TaxID=2599616 RepID=UPI0011B3B362|nr:helix-turn-helix domain-containing protein [Reyranella sp. CPCC 100927]TWS97327.1 helix-turn-helix domain-containing protein [Reyranella sp. CPCC 100927]